jgi:hypothetical protein
MKKLVGLSVVMLFVVLGLAAPSHAAPTPAGQARATLTGSVRIRNFIYPCGSAYVHTTNPLFTPLEVDTNPIGGGTCVTTDASGVYSYQDVSIPALAPTNGTLRAQWALSMFGVTLIFDNNGVDNFTFANPIPGGTPVVNQNIDVWPTTVIP